MPEKPFVSKRKRPNPYSLRNRRGMVDFYRPTPKNELRTRFIQLLPPFSAHTLFAIAHEYSFEDATIWLSIWVDFDESSQLDGLMVANRYEWTWCKALRGTCQMESSRFWVKERVQGQDSQWDEPMIVRELQRQIHNVSQEGFACVRGTGTLPQESIKLKKEEGRRDSKHDDTGDSDSDDHDDDEVVPLGNAPKPPKPEDVEIDHGIRAKYSPDLKHATCLVTYQLSTIQYLVTKGLKGIDPIAIPEKEKAPNYNPLISPSNYPPDSIPEDLKLRSGGGKIAFIFDIAWFHHISEMDRSASTAFHELETRYAAHSGSKAKAVLMILMLQVQQPPPPYTIPRMVEENDKFDEEEEKAKKKVLLESFRDDGEVGAEETIFDWL